MAQPSVSSFFITRKRGIEEDAIASKKKVICLDRFSVSSRPNENNDADDDSSSKIVYPSVKKNINDETKGEKASKLSSSAAIASVRHGITAQRTRTSKRVQMQNVDGIEAPKVVNFWMGGSLSPQKKSKKQTESIQVAEVKKKDAPMEEISYQQRNNNVMKTPTKKTTASSNTLNSEKSCIEKTLLITNNSLNTEELKKKLRGSAKLTELKTSLNKLRNGFDKLDQMERRRTGSSSSLKANASTTTETVKTLKPFRNIELEILRYINNKKNF